MNEKRIPKRDKERTGLREGWSVRLNFPEKCLHHRDLILFKVDVTQESPI